LVRDTAQDLKHLDSSDNKKRLLQQKLTKEFQSWLQKFQEINKITVEKERSNPLPTAKPSHRNDQGYQSNRSSTQSLEMDLEKQNLVDSASRKYLDD